MRSYFIIRAGQMRDNLGLMCSTYVGPGGLTMQSNYAKRFPTMAEAQQFAHRNKITTCDIKRIPTQF